MSNPQTYEVMIDNVPQPGNHATRELAEAAALAARTASPAKVITVRDVNGNVHAQPQAK